MRLRLSAVLLLWPLFGCIDAEALYVVGLSVGLVSLGSLLLLAMAFAAWWRRGKPPSTSAFVRALGWIPMGLSWAIVVIGMVALLRVVFRGLPLAVIEYVWLYATPILFIAILLGETHRKMRRALRASVIAGGIYVVAFAVVCFVFRPGNRVPSSPVVELAVSRSVVCQRHESGEVLCRGEQRGVPGRWSVPIDAGPASAIYAGGGWACLRASSSNELWCWTDDEPEVVAHQGDLERVIAATSGLYIEDASGPRNVPPPIRIESPAQMWTAQQDEVLAAIRVHPEAALSLSRVCVIHEGRVRCARGRLGAELFVDVGVLSPAEHVAIGDDLACSWEEHTVRCEGDAFGGEFRFDADVDGVTVGSAHACALSGGGVYCWGRGYGGALGSGGEDRASPHRVELNNVTALAGAGRFTCALAGGEVFCWGTALSHVRYAEEAQRLETHRLRDVFREIWYREEPTRLR